MQKSKPVVLLILDGWGHREETSFNAIALAKTPFWDSLIQDHPYRLLSGSGEDVGLPKGQMGNSEVGHLCLGAGRVIYQDLNRIEHAIENGSFARNTLLNDVFASMKKTGGKTHLLGLLSPGGVHSHENHFIETLNSAKRLKLENLYVHAFLDGRDTPPQSAESSLSLVEHWFKEYPHGGIASVCGRYYAMDRDKRYERTQFAYDMLTLKDAPFHAESAHDALMQAYERGETDEFVKPTLVYKKHPVTIDDGDCVVFMNFRADRARQLSHALTSPAFTGFKRTKVPALSHFVTMTEYDATLKAEKVFAPERITNVLGEVLQNHQLKQLRLAETEKYAHVTFFFNGGVEKPFQGEERILIPSPKVATYDLLPEMSAPLLTAQLVKTIHEQTFDVIICNFANADMVGHTGILGAAMAAVEVLDDCLQKICNALKQVGGSALITSDHGNVEQMQDPTTLKPHTAHTSELVPLVYYGPKSCTFKKGSARLADVAPTLLTLMDLPIPSDMTGQVLLECK